MNIKIDDVLVNYINYGNKDGVDVVLLHGWGQNISMMKSLGDGIRNANIYIFDLPGFGDSTEPKTAWTLDDYVEFLHKLFNKLNIKKPVLIGHSFGGELSLLYASLYEVEKVVVLDSPYRPIKKRLTLKQKMFKLAKKIPVLNKLEGFFKKHTGSKEYRSASNIMRQVLVNSVNSDITNNIKRINASVIIIWGEYDDTVPLRDAYDLEKLLIDAAVIVYDGKSHYAYLEDLGRTINIVNSFIGG